MQDELWNYFNRELSRFPRTFNFVPKTSIKVEHFFFDELMILIENGKGGKSRYVPILAGLAQELKTHLNGRQTGYIFESISS